MEFLQLKCWIFTTLWLFLESVVCSEFFADNGLAQTILVDHRNVRKRVEMENEILTLLGLHQRPNVAKHGYESSARQFMQSLYNSLKRDEGDVVPDEIEFNSKVNLTLGKAMEHINGTDVIRSFINHGRFTRTWRHSIHEILSTHLKIYKLS